MSDDVEKARLVTYVQVVEVARLRAGDAEAFRLLVERLQQPITGYLNRLVGDREVALDLAQDTFLQVYREIEKTSVDLALDAWIYRIATNYGLRYLNRKRLRQFIHFSFDAGLASDEIETNSIYEEGSSLTPKDAACLQLHFGNGFTYEQIGRIIAITPEAVRKRVARGVEKFRAVYGREAL